MKALKILVFFLALFLMTGGVYADYQNNENPGGSTKIYHFKPQGHNFLNLTPEQITKLRQLRENFQKDTIFLRNSLNVKRLELKALWTVPRPEKDQIIAKEKEIIDLTTQLRMKVVDFRLEARGILTPEQAAQIGMWGPRLWHKGRWGRRMWPSRS
jgi:Spy/CpxP family protein refolding chaperone